MSSQKIITPVWKNERVRGDYTPPPDKSITHRALILAALSSQESTIRNPLAAEDCLSTLHALRGLGVSVQIKKNLWKVRGGIFRRPRSPIDCGNSGTTMRLLSGVLSAQGFKTRLSGDASLSRRPMKRVIEPLRRMGAKIKANKNFFAPLEITGNPDLKSISWKIPVASAQVKSAILLAGSFARGKTTVVEPSRSRDHTERMLASLGAKINFKTNGSLNQPNRISIWGPIKPGPLRVTVPGDFSSAAFFIAAALLVPNSELRIRNVNLNPTRIGCLQVLRKMGAGIQTLNLRKVCGEPIGDLRVRSSRLKGISVIGKEIPLMIDELPIFAVLATQARGKTTVSGARELRVKESDRIAAIASQLKKMGARVREKKDGLIITGPTPLTGAAVRTFVDHRMAMSLAVAGLIASGKTLIRDFDCVGISYPNFLRDLRRIIRTK